MAEINIEKKRSVSPLIFFIILALLALAGWYYYANYMMDTPATVAPAATTSALEPNRANATIGDLA